MAQLIGHIMMATGQLAPFETAIRDALSRAEAAASRIVDVPKTDVIIRDWPESTIAQDGIGGFCPRRREIEIAIDPAHPALGLGPGGALDRTLVHELHHVLRRDSVGYGETLGEALVSEGLAGHFVGEVLGTLPEPWESAIRSPDLPIWARTALAAWDRTNYDHADWFYGRGDLPLWIGYALGFSIVGSYLDIHPTKTAGGLSGLSAHFFVARAEGIAKGR